MLRQFFLAVLALAVAACAAQRTPRYVVRLDLDRIAEQSAAKQPGFTILKPSTASPVNPS
jgi:hypothetical protein